MISVHHAAGTWYYCTEGLAVTAANLDRVHVKPPTSKLLILISHTESSFMKLLTPSTATYISATHTGL